MRTFQGADQLKKDGVTKQWGPRIIGTKGKKAQKQHSEQDLTECTLGLPELFFMTDQMSKQIVMGSKMKDNKSKTMKRNQVRRERGLAQWQESKENRCKSMKGN